MAIPLPSVTDPILYHERTVWVKGIATGLILPIDLEQVGGQPITLGQKALGGGNLPVVLPSNQWPTGIRLSVVAVNTNATINTIDTNNNAVAAPGAGLTTRIWAVHLGGLPNRTGNLWAILEDQTTTGGLAEVACPPGGNDELVIPGGILMSASNHAVRVRESSNVASQSFRCLIYYTVE